MVEPTRIRGYLPAAWNGFQGRLKPETFVVWVSGAETGA
jgi:hypothetical protein